MKRALMIFGAVALLFTGVITAGLGYLGTKAYLAAEANKTAAIHAVTEISKEWSVIGRYDIVDRSLINVAETPRVEQFMRNIGRLGKLVKIKDAQQVHFGMSTTDGTTAVIEFQGEFTNGTGKVIAKMRKADGKMKLYGIKIEDGKLKPKKPETTA